MLGAQVMVVGHEFKAPSNRHNVAKVPSVHKPAAPQPGSKERIAIPGFCETRPGVCSQHLCQHDIRSQAHSH